MNRRYLFLIVILLVVILGVWINLPNNPGLKIGNFERTLETQLGLDLRGGVQVLLEAERVAEPAGGQGRVAELQQEGERPQCVCSLCRNGTGMTRSCRS